MRYLDIAERVKKIKAIVTDIDGVMTDGRFGYSESGEVKFFNTQDGMAFVLAKKLGYIIGAISGRAAVANQRRAKELKFDFLFENISTKSEAFNEVLDKYKIKAEECLYIGDDIQDVCLVQKAGIGVLTANAPVYLHVYADIVTKKPGGHGAVREVVDWLIDITGKKNEILKLYGVEENE